MFPRNSRRVIAIQLTNSQPCTAYRAVAASCHHEPRGERLYARNRTKPVGLFRDGLGLDVRLSFLSSSGR